MKTKWVIPGVVLLLALTLFVPACGRATTPTSTTTSTQTSITTLAPGEIVLGGQLYDNWMKTAQVATPTENSPLWATQTTNTRTGTDTWRCKECHGWDYRGKDGAYATGSHFTGFPGVYNAATTKDVPQLVGILKGSSNPDHDFSTYLNDEQLGALATFLKEGAVIDETQYIDYSTKKTKSADSVKGKQLYDASCVVCHGTDGKMLNFGSAEEPEFVGTIALDNPWEFLHKVRFGQPGTSMPSGVELEWSIQDTIDVLSHSQTLPKE